MVVTPLKRLLKGVEKELWIITPMSRICGVWQLPRIWHDDNDCKHYSNVSAISSFGTAMIASTQTTKCGTYWPGYHFSLNTSNSTVPPQKPRPIKRTADGLPPSLTSPAAWSGCPKFRRSKVRMVLSTPQAVYREGGEPKDQRSRDTTNR